MLTAIELVGFKTFAVKTRIEFPAGVTVVVGPNGSGKSNVVDAIKWVLGSQSAKSLRGKEMTDVIFNGSGSRSALQTAEVTLTLDNSEGRLPTDSPEVHITRRVYRSGEGEYLLNRQPCRLRDLRDLLAGTGITTEAYSMIEQGKVDAVLQSSPRDRRIIFEEAAGISRFKAKRTEAGRRLERVEQNLLRLSDLVDEVESRLRSVRMQAGKAKRYRDYATRLEELRTAIGLNDWNQMTVRLATLDDQSADCQRQMERQQRSLEQAEGQLDELERQIERAGNDLLQLESAVSANRERIMAVRKASKQALTFCAELESERARAAEQLAAMSTRADDVSTLARSVEDQLDTARAELAAAERQFAESDGQVDQARSEFERLGGQSQTLQSALAASAEKMSQFSRHMKILRSQHSTAEAARVRCDERLQGLAIEHRKLEAEVERNLAAQLQYDRDLKETETALQVARQRGAERKDICERTQKKVHAIDSQLTRLRERIAVLEELDQRREGYFTGVKDVLQQQRDGTGPFRDVCGIVADLFHVDVDSAPLIEVALGDKAQHLVIDSGVPLLNWLQTERVAVNGRVGFLRLDVRAPASAVDRINLSAEDGVLGRADSFVETEPRFSTLVSRLLGRTWVVNSLATAVRLAGSIGRGLSFVTADGEWLGADGLLVVGPRQAAAGLLSRASELRAARDQVGQLEQQIATQKKRWSRFESEVASCEETLGVQGERHAAVLHKLSLARHAAIGANQRLALLVRQQNDLQAELDAAESHVMSLNEELAAAERQREESRQQSGRLQQELHVASAGRPALEKRVRELERAATDAQVAVATRSQRVAILTSQCAQAARDQVERERALDAICDRLHEVERRHQRAQREALIANQTEAELALEKEQIAVDRGEAAALVHSLRQQRSAAQRDLQTERVQVGKLQGELGRVEIAANKLRHERDTLWERLRDDYDIEINAAADECRQTVPIENRREIEAEISQLRQRLNSIGAVNLDALEELDSLEERFDGLSGQYRDLVDSKAALEKIILRINSESRQLFVATLETVRGHFQDLFRRLFGGGEADIVLQDSAGDVLESGIEIVARPPGKETRTISLLSGGEKTMTCVALLLAVFRSKPSPFCVLDEVDAALDEANIGRFTGVLREFLSSTQFIVVTHSKRTMVGADTLYGVTMQESGVSKLVSVRFDDVSEDGEIRPASNFRELSGTAGDHAEPRSKAA